MMTVFSRSSVRVPGDGARLLSLALSGFDFRMTVSLSVRPDSGACSKTGMEPFFKEFAVMITVFSIRESSVRGSVFFSSAICAFLVIMTVFSGSRCNSPGLNFPAISFCREIITVRCRSPAPAPVGAPPVSTASAATRSFGEKITVSGSSSPGPSRRRFCHFARMIRRIRRISFFTAYTSGAGSVPASGAASLSGGFAAPDNIF